MVIAGASVTDKSDKFVLSIKEERGDEISNVDFDVLVIFEKPSLLHKDYPLALVNNHTLLVNKGEFAYIDREHLNVVDFKNQGTSFLYQLKALPKNGKIKLKNVTMALNGTFSQADINLGYVTFHQNGKGEESDWDYFVFAILNGEGKAIAGNALPIKVITDNTAPVFIHKNDLVVERGGKTEIGKDTLRVTDQEQGPEGLTFELLAQPKYGALHLSDGGKIKQGGHFTQADINEGKLSYQHGGETLEDDAFAFKVSDGEGGVTARTVLSVQVGDGAKAPSPSKEETVDKGAEPAETSEEGASTESLCVNEGASLMIVPKDLALFCDPAMGHMDFELTLTQPPQHGVLCKGRVPPKPNMAFRRGEAMKEGETFSKQDLLNGLITYEHTDLKGEADAFSLKIRDNRRGHTHRYEAKLRVEKENKAPILVKKQDLMLTRGSQVKISNRLLKAVDAEQSAEQLHYILVSRPKEGSLTLEGKALNNADSFTQAQIDQGKLAYTHNGSEEKEDRFIFTLTDGHGGNLEKVSVGIHILEQNIALLHHHPLSVVAQECIPLNSKHLEVLFLDENKSSLSYEIKGLPQKGRLLINGEPLELGSVFTDEDLENGRVSYQHAPQ